MITIIDHYRPAQNRVWILEARSEKVCGNDNFNSEKGLRFREPEATHPHHKNSQECPFHLFIYLFLSHSHFTKIKRYKRRSLKYKLLWQGTLSAAGSLYTNKLSLAVLQRITWCRVWIKQLCNHADMASTLSPCASLYRNSIPGGSDWLTTLYYRYLTVAI